MSQQWTLSAAQPDLEMALVLVVDTCPPPTELLLPEEWLWEKVYLDS